MSTQVDVAAPTATSTTTPAAPSGPAPTSGPVSRDAMRGTDYEGGAALLSPSGPPGSTYRVQGDAKGLKDGERFFDPKKQTKVGEVDGVGYGYGNRAGDLDANGKPATNKTIDSAAFGNIPEPELDKLKAIHKQEVAGPVGTYRGYEVAGGQTLTTDVGADLGHKPGKGDSASVAGPSYQAGGVARAYAGIKGAASNDYGSVAGKAEGHAKGYYGVSGKAGLAGSHAAKDGKLGYGASAEGAIGAGAEIGAKAQADAKTAGYKMEGVDAPIDLGVGVSASARAYAKAGVGAGAHLSKEKIGVTAAAGIGSAIEGKAGVHGNIGPVKTKYEAGLLAGLGAGAEGAIIYEGGKLVIGGRAYAAIGYGASAGLGVTVDVKQGYQMTAAILKKAAALGVRGAKEAFEAVDRDNDGKLSLNDAATEAASSMDKGAKRIERGVDGAIAFLDGDGDGKFDPRKDMDVRGKQAIAGAADLGKRALGAGGRAVDRAKGAVGDAGEAIGDAATGAKKAVGDAVGKAKAKARSAADLDSDGKLTRGDFTAGIARAGGWASQKVSESMGWANQKKDEAVALGKAELARAHAAVTAAHKLADRSGDGKLDMADVAKGAGEVYDAGKQAGAAVGEAVMDAGERAVEGVRDLGKKGRAAADRDGDGKLGTADLYAGVAQAKQAVTDKKKAIEGSLSSSYEAAKKRIGDGLGAVRDAVDVKKDGKIDWADAEAVGKAVEAEAKQRSDAALQAAQASIKRLEAQAFSTIDLAKKLADRDGDGQLGFGDVKEGAAQGYHAARAKAGEAKAAVVEGAKAGFKSAAEGVSRAGDTLATGYDTATARVGGALGRFSKFVGL